jgi:hypothetical protein
MKTTIPYPTNDQENFVVDGNKDEDVGVITTYISQDIHFHISGIEFPHQSWKILKSLFNKVNEIHIMQMDKELISLNPHSFDIIEYYLTWVNELEFKFNICGKNY